MARRLGIDVSPLLLVIADRDRMKVHPGVVLSDGPARVRFVRVSSPLRRFAPGTIPETRVDKHWA
jgi:hypothetical protein